jgi:putative mRNA 3-end processing factor
MGRFRRPQTAFASGWMAVRGARRRRGYERGFVLSDHADWNGLVRTARESGARQIYLTHGQSDVLARYLREVEGLQADPLEGGFEAERSPEGEPGPEQDPEPGPAGAPEEGSGKEPA